MRKTPKQRAPMSKQAFQVAKSALTPAGQDTLKTKTVDFASGKQFTEQINNTSNQNEEEIMGETGQGNKSGAMEKNLTQMVNVLNNRLQSLEAVVKSRIKLCDEDLLPNSIKSTKTHAPRIGDESDEAIPRSLKDTKLVSSSHKDNLVSSDTVYIDPYHLVLKTKQATEAAKQLEQNLEESFGNNNLREMKSKKSKTMNQSEKSKKSEQLKNEAKRINRLKIEKTLQLNMETFLTRSVMDTDKRFKVPSRVNDEADWPISIKWSNRDPRCQRAENNEGEFDPELLLRYGLERINLPSGKKLFSWLIRQSVIQRYFVTLFWLVKVKFFETDQLESSAETEAYLLRLMAIEYRQIVELLAARAHAEHEKDFAFKFLPFILANSTYFGFYFLFPGSRHIYTKGFKKTIYMQVIQLMHGIQLCPATVKVSWAKLFPEDNHEDGGEGNGAGEGAGDDAGGGGGGESFPVQIALKEPKFGIAYTTKMRALAGNRTMEDDSVGSEEEQASRNTKNTLPSSKHSVRELPPLVAVPPSKHGRPKFGRLVSDNHDERAAPTVRVQHLHPSQMAGSKSAPGHFPGQAPLSLSLSSANNASFTNSGTNSPYKTSGAHTPGGLNINQRMNVRRLRASVSALHVGVSSNESFVAINALHAAHTAAAQQGNSFVSLDASDRDSSLDNIPGVVMVADSPNGKFVRQDTGASFFAGASSQGYLRAQNHVATDDFFDAATTQEPLLRTYLKPPAERPKNKFTVKRQNNFEAMNALGMSPQMEMYLATMDSTAGPGVSRTTQTFRRTVPINWCAAGGSDTHRKRVVATDLHADISAKLRASEMEFRRETSKFHRMRTQSLQEIDTALEKVLSSGPTNISKFSLDIRRQRNAKDGTLPAENGGGVTALGGAGGAGEQMTLAEAAQLAMFDDDDLDRFIREL